MITTIAELALGGLLASEASLRRLLHNHPKVNRLDPVVGWRPRPGLRFHYGREGSAPVSINAAGFRDIDHERSKPAGIRRIVVLGDSVVEAREVPIEETFWKQLESLLPTAPGERVEVMNFGVNGYSTAQSLLTLDRIALDYAPDLVIQVFFTGTDVTGNARVLGYHRDRPYFGLVNGRLRLLSVPGDAPGYRRRLWQDALRTRLYDLRLPQLVREVRVRARLFRQQKRYSGGPARPDLNHGIYRPPTDADWTEAWEVSEALIAEVAARATAGGAEFLLVICPNAPQVDPDPAVAPTLCRMLGIDRLDYPERRLEAFAARTGLPCLALAHGLGKAASAGERVFGDGVHLNRNGHRVAAAAIAEAVTALPAKLRPSPCRSASGRFASIP